MGWIGSGHVREGLSSDRTKLYAIQRSDSLGRGRMDFSVPDGKPRFVEPDGEQKNSELNQNCQRPQRIDDSVQRR
jgi:hypothetical protein